MLSTAPRDALATAGPDAAYVLDAVQREAAETAVDYRAIGALTHSAPALGLRADLRTV